MTDQIEVLDLFSEPTKDWFRNTFSEPTSVQKKAWPAIAKKKPVLISAPTGTGKTLSAFLYFVDQLKLQAREGSLKQELSVIYISPLKSLAADIRENLNRPLSGIVEKDGVEEIQVGIRTGDTPQKERQRMVRRPPHILITTPESLYLMLSSATGRKVLCTAKAVIVDELHAMIDTKRGAHFLFSLSRLDQLCSHHLQRIGLSATIEPLELAAAYLSLEQTEIVAPKMNKKIEIEVQGTLPPTGRRKDPVWEELGRAVYERCQGKRSVIAFSEGRRYAEKTAYFVNELGGDGFARVHHGSLSKEQRAETEKALRDGKLRLLCATSSMELGIDVGEIDEVLQIGCPRSISSTMQRLGRAGHNPGRVSKMCMYPRTAPEALYCGMTACVAIMGGVEHAKPPRKCLDVLAQHLVSMANAQEYHIDDVVALCRSTYSFQDVSREEIEKILCMLAGDYEHGREIPVRPRILYDRLAQTVKGDTYSRMLAVSAGGTIPDKGLYIVKSEDGVRLGELDEEFVYESRIGDRFVLGSFAWRIVRQDRDTVVVRQANTEGARLPFWKGETGGRQLKTSLAFGKILRNLEQAWGSGELLEKVKELGLDEGAAHLAADFLVRQIKATGGLPNDQTIIVEHFKDHTQCAQIMVHSLLGKRINAPLSILLQQAAKAASGINVGCVDEEDGFLLYPYGKEELPKGLLYTIDPLTAGDILKALLPVTPLFGMTFRYNAARALMMGMKQNGRTPLWLQRLRSTEMLDSLVNISDHPLIAETKRECLEDAWDLDGLIEVLHKIRSGAIRIKEVSLDVPSPMSLPLQWQIEAAQMYEYYPVTSGMQQNVFGQMENLAQIKPSNEELKKAGIDCKIPENEEQLHAKFMIEGDFFAEELGSMPKWLLSLKDQQRIMFIEPGLWIAAEKKKEYDAALLQNDKECAADIVRRMLYYRGEKTQDEIGLRYLFTTEFTKEILKVLCESGQVILDDVYYYHAKLYERARKNTVKNLRLEITTHPSHHYTALLALRARCFDKSLEQLKKVMEIYCNQAYPLSFWESVLFPARIKGYREDMLDQLLSQGDYYWKITSDTNLCFGRLEDWDWESCQEAPDGLTEEELLVYTELKKRGASFAKALNSVLPGGNAQNVLLELAGKGIVCADSFIPVRQWINRNAIKKASVRQRVNARITALSAGRWDIVRSGKEIQTDEILQRMLIENVILCRETFKKAAETYELSAQVNKMSWSQALEILSIWEFSGRVRRGYFVEGLSGAQFIRKEEYESIIAFLKHPEQELMWMNAQDPAQIWGKILPHQSGRSFQNVSGTLVALKLGQPVAVLERNGKTLRIFEMECMEDAISCFVQAFLAKQLYKEVKRLVIKEYPKEAAGALRQAGFLLEMKDFVLYM